MRKDIENELWFLYNYLRHYHMLIRKNDEKSLKTIDNNKEKVYNKKACKIALKWNVATTIDKPEVGGNFHGACHGLDQAVRFIKTKHLSQDIHA